MKLHQIKATIYQRIFEWAVNKWRKTLRNPTLKSYDGKLSVHAIVRYLERIEGRDMQAELVTDELKALIKQYGGSGKFVVNDILYTVDKGKIMTVARPNPNQAVIAGLNKDSGLPRKWSF